MIKIISFIDAAEAYTDKIKEEIDRMLSGNIWRLVAVTTSKVNEIVDRHHYHFHRVTQVKP